MSKYKVTAVSYLNTKPLLYGILRSPVARQLQLSLNIPSACARMLQTGEADLGLVPVAVLPELDEWHLLSDYCIGANGAVQTVCLFGDRPLEEWTTVYLDYHSRTSVELARLLLRDYWQRPDLRLVPAHPGYEGLLGGNTGGLVIGDRTIALEQRLPFVYDLGEAWMDYTGLPFVFAAWVSRRQLPEAFVADFNAALHLGVSLIPELKYLLPSPHPDFDLENYYTHHISYELDEPKRQALRLFLQYLRPVVPASGRGNEFSAARIRSEIQ